MVWHRTAMVAVRDFHVKQRMNKMMHVMNNDEQLMEHEMSMNKRRNMKNEAQMDEKIMRATAQQKQVKLLLQQVGENDPEEPDCAAAREQRGFLVDAAPVEYNVINLPFDERQMQHRNMVEHDDEKTCPSSCLTVMGELPQSCPTEASLRHLLWALNEVPMRIIGETSDTCKTEPFHANAH